MLVYLILLAFFMIFTMEQALASPPPPPTRPHFFIFPFGNIKSPITAHGNVDTAANIIKSTQTGRGSHPANPAGFRRGPGRETSVEYRDEKLANLTKAICANYPI